MSIEKKNEKNLSYTPPGGVADVLAAHVIVGVYGGTATGSTWECSCGATETVPGTRDVAAALGVASGREVGDR